MYYNPNYGYRKYIGGGWTRHEVFEKILREHPPKTEYTPGDWVVLMVRFNLDGGTYCYLSNDDIYETGDLVTVKVRGEEKVVEVVSVGYYSDADYPFKDVHVKTIVGPADKDLAAKYKEAIEEELTREEDDEAVRAEAKKMLEEARAARSEAYRDRQEAEKERQAAYSETEAAKEDREAAKKQLAEAERILSAARRFRAGAEHAVEETQAEGEKARKVYQRLEAERREAAKVWKKERPKTDEQMILGLRKVQDALDEDEQIYRGLSDLETVITRVIQRIDEKVREQDALGSAQSLMTRDITDKLYGFYLPKTIDVLEQYRNIFSSGLPRKNVEELRKDVLKVIGESSDVYGKILSELYASDMMKLSAELDALRMMFEFEGLTDSDFDVR